MDVERDYLQILATYIDSVSSAPDFVRDDIFTIYGAINYAFVSGLIDYDAFDYLYYEVRQLRCD